MQHITLTIADINQLNYVAELLSNEEPIRKEYRDYLIQFLKQIPDVEIFLSEQIPSSETIDLNIIHRQEAMLNSWLALLSLGPGWDYAPFCYLVAEVDSVMLAKNVIMVTQFAPTMSHNLDHSKRGFQLWFKDDRTAIFWLPTLEDAEKYSDLYRFNGSWVDAYKLLVATWEKGWPMEEFPEELKPFLKK